jgi:FG-GAP-like repeat/FG-GAP repeat
MSVRSSFFVPRVCSCAGQSAATVAIGLLAAASVAASSLGAFAQGGQFGGNDTALEGAIMVQSAPDEAVTGIALSNAATKLRLDSWTRHVIDPARPGKAIFVSSQDMSGDGRRDIVSGAWWYRNPGSLTGTWVRRVIGAPLNNMAAVRDFDGDGDLDVLGTQGTGSKDNHSFAWARNNGAGAFTVLTNIATGGSGDFLQGVAVARFVRGGPLEVALSWHNGGGGIHKLRVPSSPSSVTWTFTTLSTTTQREQLNAGDIDRDGDQDLLLGTPWLRNNGSSWAPFTLFSTSAAPDRNRLADVNRDGRVDAIVGYEAISVKGKLAWYEQPVMATSRWTEHVISQNVVGPMSLDVADLDADGDRDVIVGEHNLANPASARLFIFEDTNGRGASWTRHTVYTGDEHHDGARIADMDGDGDLDIVSIGWGHKSVLLYENRAR